MRILQVALDTPLRRTFDYAWPGEEDPPHPGVRLRVPFGRRRLVGVLIDVAADSAVAPAKLKPILEVLDPAPLFDSVTFGLLCWAADYYHHPIGEVFAAAMPGSVRTGIGPSPRERRWRLAAAGAAQLSSKSRAPRIQQLLAWLELHPEASSRELIEAGFDARVRRIAAERGWIELAERPSVPSVPVAAPSEVEATPEQAHAIQAITDSLGSFCAYLLFGVTGSGKTEVYLQVIAAVIARGEQALVLVPEIALTPQLVARFERRFSSGVAVIHSQLAGSERRDAWQAAGAGQAHIVVGTRSAIFAPLPRLGLIVIDEEHDNSFKQQEGFHYSARDLAVVRAQRAKVPVVLGSATPSLESLDNALHSRYRTLRLPRRAQAAAPLKMSLVDLRKTANEQSISQPVLGAMAAHLGRGGQVIVFLNRRGFAPTMYCRVCAWSARCDHCDARLTMHRRASRLRCHHCGAETGIPASCPQCQQPLSIVGQGTERVEDTLSRFFPNVAIARLDRDSAAPRGAMQSVLDTVHRGEARILVGTQMLTKGHHFEEVSLVVVLDADQGLFSTDYRAAERLAQTITQVAGRAGRAARAGEVLIQTAFPDHPLLKQLISGGYEAFAHDALQERKRAAWPPFSRLAMLRADATDAQAVDAFLHTAAAASAGARPPDVKVLGPAVALIARRADRHRAHLLIESPSRSSLQLFLRVWLARVDALRKKSGLRWSIDVDPSEID